MTHCCTKMKGFIKDHEEIEYDFSVDGYSIVLSEDEDATRQKLCYCPWCGKEYRLGLGYVWMDILRDEYGIIDPIFDDRDKVPPEFWTDEWWRKRGL